MMKINEFGGATLTTCNDVDPWLGRRGCQGRSRLCDPPGALGPLAGGAGALVEPLGLVSHLSVAPTSASRTQVTKNINGRPTRRHGS
jgi:hypothetical protein